MSKLDSALSLFAAATVLTTTLVGCRDAALPTRLLTPRSPLRTEVATAPVVNSLADDGDGTCTDTKCTLRDAIAFANSGAAITFSVTGTITLAQSEIAIAKDLTISGPGASQLALDGHLGFRVLDIVRGSTVSISGLTVENGGQGSPNTANFGGGVANFGTLTLTNVMITKNSTPGSVGGGIFNAQTGKLTIVGSTITQNESGTGGGIANQLAVITIINSTISGNSAFAAGAFAGSGTATLINSTIVGNTGSITEGGVSFSPLGTMTIINTIIAGNVNRDCDFVDNPTPKIVDGGYNIDGDGTCGFTAPTSLSNTSPELDPSGLQNNGGPTLTIDLLFGSPAIDAIPLGVNGCGTTINVDQRGTARPFNKRCDIGAVEVTSPGGFLPPINNVRTTPIHPGAGVPVQFILGGDRGLAIFAQGSPSSAQIACPLSDASSQAIPTETAGHSGLSYDPITDTYTYVWKTEKSWANTCRRLIVTFTDGRVRTADFSFER